jgi:DNA (cytosine-5)-methyltransferase 1
LPYVIENVMGAPLINPVKLCGTSFGLRIRHHRLFEASFRIPPLECAHKSYAMNPHNVKGRARISAEFPGEKQMHVWAREKGLPWLQSNWKELKNAVPPVMTEYVGRQLLSAMRYDQERAA